MIQHRQKKDIVRVSEFPITANGMAEFQIVNVMAGLAAALAMVHDAVFSHSSPNTNPDITHARS